MKGGLESLLKELKSSQRGKPKQVEPGTSMRGKTRNKKKPPADLVAEIKRRLKLKQPKTSIAQSLGKSYVFVANVEKGRYDEQ